MEENKYFRDVTSPEEIKKVKDKILELIELLPGSDHTDYEALILAMEIQSDLTALLKRNDGTSKDIEHEIDRARKKKEALTDLLAMNDTVDKLRLKLKPEVSKEMAQQSSGIKKYMKHRSTQGINERQTIRNNAAAAVAAKHENVKKPDGNSSEEDETGNSTDLLDDGGNSEAQPT